MLSSSLKMKARLFQPALQRGASSDCFGQFIGSFHRCFSCCCCVAILGGGRGGPCGQ